jgi:hypothetical protein
MKRVIFFFLASTGFAAAAQNVGIGTSSPANKFHVIGSMLVNEPTIGTNTSPSPAQTITLINATTVTFPSSDSTGYIYDPGGPSGNYIGNLTGYALVLGAANVGFELIISDIDLNIGDSLIIMESSGSTNPPFLAVGNGYNTTQTLTINSAAFYLVFKSNADANTGRGFSLQFRRLYRDAGSPSGIKGSAGNAMYYDAKWSAFRTGIMNNAPLGPYSFASGITNTAIGQAAVAMGSNNIANGGYAIALGGSNTASAQGAIAMGTSTTASGYSSMATGFNTVASNSYTFASGSGATATNQNSVSMGYGTVSGGIASVALGYNTVANGAAAVALGYNSYAANYATAMGVQTTASGSNSTAMGNYVSTAGYSGAFIIGDNSTTSVLNAAGVNSFRARFVGGYALFTGLGPSVGVVVNPGGNAWSAISDVRLKENFLPVNGESVLKSIAAMPQYTWNYKQQDPRTFRHYGPMAQDFYKAFGKDGLGTIGCDTLINQHDFLGVSFIAIQALEKRTTDLNNKLVTENNMLKDELAEMKQKLAAIEKLVQGKYLKDQEICDR